jgi:hypothetical protein
MSDRLFRDRRDAGRVLVGLLEPLERTARWEAGEAPETYPLAV